MSSETVVSSGKPSRPHSQATRTIAIVAVAILLVGGAAFKLATRPAAVATSANASKTTEAPAASAAVEVRVEPVTVGTLDQPVRVTGTLRTDETVTLSTKAAGLV